MVRDIYMFSKIDKEAEVVWFKVTYENTVHSEVDITSFFADNGLDIRFAYFDSSEDPSKGKYVMFTEVEKSRDIKSIADKLGKLDVVLNLDWGFSKNRVIQSVEFPLYLMGERAVVIRVKTFVKIFNIIKEHVPGSDGLMTIVGVASGVDTVKYLRKIAVLNDSNFLDLLKELVMAAGWGILDHEVDIVNLEGTIRINNSFIAEEHRESDVPVCIYMSAFFSGYLSEYLKRTVHVHETRCKSMGDVFCEHQVSPVPEGVSAGHTLKGESY